MAKVKDKEAKFRIESAISKLITFYPLFGTVFLYLNKRESYSLPTMAVGVTRRVDLALYYNPDFVNKLGYEELKAVLIHESMHVLLHHISRAAHYNFSMKGFNIAADMAINCNIQNLPDGAIYPSTFQLPNNEAAEWYYRSIKREAEKNGKSIEEMMGEAGADLVDDHSMWGECEDDVVKEKIKGIASKAIAEQEKNGWGNIPGDVVQKVLAANRSIVNWKKEVRYFINKLVYHGQRSTRSRINRREQTLASNRTGHLKDIYLHPGKKKQYTSRLLVAIDTSGSVTDKELEEFVTEVNGMIDHVQCEYICFDTKMYGPPKPFSKKAKDLEIEGRGGTNFYPVCEFIDEEKYDGLIIMTDGFAPFPPKPRARVMWCLTKSGESVDPPFGKKVVIESRKR